ncbi:uncharacterized protein BO80DRAFT_427089 [Aspergillus ibericus CBS 121593]|uniref:Uncharacterized protein n=1 Tax=Aspergillus ibericus CBS 121593 TaxID=1448316 RepID=A0A395GSZ7_9EURO|nr:hypothetical protein BO80DRAFT_427089 [Aspergillus ibericus CBS 121593]RAK98711.1 hypothetical protein BO80DRAFT_427089 [Aspergillus ibericus CBS 121593]
MPNATKSESCWPRSTISTTRCNDVMAAVQCMSNCHCIGATGRPPQITSKLLPSVCQTSVNIGADFRSMVADSRAVTFLIMWLKAFQVPCGMTLWQSVAVGYASAAMLYTALLSFF